MNLPILNAPMALVAVGLALLAGCASLADPRSAPKPVVADLGHCLARSAQVDGDGSTGAEQALPRVVVSAASDSASSYVERGFRKSLQGDRDGAIAAFERALAHTEPDLEADRMRWSYGWAMFNAKDYRCALAQFEQARRIAPQQVSWLPQTLAITYWQLGEHENAIAWYHVAATGAPGCWADARSAEACTRHWQRAERRALGEVISAWKQWRVGNG